MEENKRLFFGAEVRAAWPKDLPEGRVIEEEHRHMTLVFLGASSFSDGEKIPKPSFKCGIVGFCDAFLFLSHVVAANVKWLEKEKEIKNYQKQAADFFSVKEKHFLPHVSIARSPFKQKEWEKIFTPFPLMITGFHLYESIGNLHYKSLWEQPLVPPFEELEHTADIAFRIHAEDLQQLHLHAQMALCFKHPQLLHFFSTHIPESLDDIIIDLNEIIAKADAEIGTPFKAVSFHGALKKDTNGIFSWEMIVDV